MIRHFNIDHSWSVCNWEDLGHIWWRSLDKRKDPLKVCEQFLTSAIAISAGFDCEVRILSGSFKTLKDLLLQLDSVPVAVAKTSWPRCHALCIYLPDTYLFPSLQHPEEGRTWNELNSLSAVRTEVQLPYRTHSIVGWQNVHITGVGILRTFTMKVIDSFPAEEQPIQCRFFPTLSFKWWQRKSQWFFHFDIVNSRSNHLFSERS